MPVELPRLPCAFNVLEPVISGRQLTTRYEKFAARNYEKATAGPRSGSRPARRTGERDMNDPHRDPTGAGNTARRVRARGARREVCVKRAWDAPAAADGMRVLVDRLWPRGMSRRDLAVDFWLKEVAPSTALRRWFGHEPARWRSFAAKYSAELAQHADLLRLLDDMRRRGRLTLVYGARDEAHNHALVLRDVIEGRRGPVARARARRRRRAG